MKILADRGQVYNGGATSTPPSIGCVFVPDFLNPIEIFRFLDTRYNVQLGGVLLTSEYYPNRLRCSRFRSHGGNPIFGKWRWLNQCGIERPDTCLFATITTPKQRLKRTGLLYDHAI